MKVVQLIPELREGGVERGVVELNRGLVAAGVQNGVISLGGPLAALIEFEGGFHERFDVCSKNPLTFPSRVLGLRRLLRRLEPDIIHVRSRVPAWLARYANRHPARPLVSTVHGFNRVGRYSRIMTRADRVICVSRAVREFVQSHYGVPDERIRLIHRGVDLELFRPDGGDPGWMEAFRREQGLEGRFVVSAVGRVTQLKDLETFIRAVGVLARSRPEVLGLVVGGVREDKRDYFEGLQRLVRELGLEERVRFTGSVRDVTGVYRLSRVVVCASRKPESFGRSVAEAIATNTPVVATGHGGVTEIVREGENGLFVPVGDPEGLADAVERAARLRFDGHAYVAEHFSLARMVEQTLDVYRELLPSGGRGV